MKNETMNEPTKYFTNWLIQVPCQFSGEYFQREINLTDDFLLVQDLATDLASYVSLLSVPWLTVGRPNGSISRCDKRFLLLDKGIYTRSTKHVGSAG